MLLQSSNFHDKILLNWCAFPSFVSNDVVCNNQMSFAHTNFLLFNTERNFPEKALQFFVDVINTFCFLFDSFDQKKS